MHSEIIINKQYEDINPVQFGYESCEKSHHFGPAARMHWLFHFVVSGKGVFRIGDKEHLLSAGMMFVIPPYVETYYEADSKDPWEYIWVGFTGNPPLKLNDCYHIPRALQIFEHMKASCNYNKGKTEFVLAKIWELFSLLIEEAEAETDSVDKVLNLIHSEYMMPLTVQQMANSIHLERTYFSNLFRRRTGVSPKQYLINYRMQQARTLLAQGYSVTVSAKSVGYSDVYIFSKMFKRYFGIAPSYYQADDSPSDSVT